MIEVCLTLPAPFFSSASVHHCKTSSHSVSWLNISFLKHLWCCHRTWGADGGIVPFNYLLFTPDQDGDSLVTFPAGSLLKIHINPKWPTSNADLLIWKATREKKSLGSEVYVFLYRSAHRYLSSHKSLILFKHRVYSSMTLYRHSVVYNTVNSKVRFELLFSYLYYETHCFVGL